MADDRKPAAQRDTEQAAPPPRPREARPEPSPAAERVTLDAMLVVPLVDVHEAERIYDPSIPRLALAGGLAGALVLGVLAYLVGSGVWPVAGFGQFSAAGAGVATFTGAGIGLATGGLLGALAAVRRLPSR